MRIKEKTPFASTCAKMSGEKSVNGDIQSNSKNCDDSEESETKRNSSPNNSAEYEGVSGPRLKTFKGKGVSCNSIQRETEDTSNPNSPKLYFNECETSSSGGSGVSGGLSYSGSNSGGRLKFFKDGKFILELSHRKDGEKTCWIPVPKKTYWPVVGTPRQESSTSLSVSDDNSSVQSSPWQRDHCWKQTTPRCNISKELEFRMFRPGYMRKLRYTSRAVHAKRRKPTDSTKVDQALLVRVRVKVRKRTPLDNVVQSLVERVISIYKTEPGIVSPRKRILRELERVSLEEATKRQRARPPVTTTRTVSSHSISAILAREDDSVLRTLLRSPSPTEATRTPPHPPLQQRLPSSPYLPSSSPSSSSSTSSHSLHSGHPPPSSTTTYYPQVPPPYRPPHNLWPVHYPISSPTLPLPIYPPYHASLWPIRHPMSQDASADVPLNLSKHSG